MNMKTLLLAATLMVTGCKQSGSSGSGSGSAPSAVAARAAAAVMQGRFTPNKEGVVDLPANFQSASVNQKAYVKRDEGGTIWVLLPETTDANFKGQLFSSKPPAEKPAKLQIIGPRAGGTAGPVEVTVDSAGPEESYAVHAGG
jgi:hypothetical protein